jgi:hypothetical protein
VRARQDTNGAAIGDETRDEIAADVPGAAGDQNWLQVRFVK